MKRILLVLTVVISLFACSEDSINTYSGSEFIYFGNRTEYSWVYWDTVTSFNFLYEPGIEEKILQIKVSRGGLVPADEDKEFLIDVNVISGTEGVDFDIDRVQIMPGGQAYMYIPVTLYKTEALDNNSFEMDITLLPNENFTLDLPYVYQDGDTIQRTTMHIEYMNLLQAPPVWTQREVYIGYFSEAKFNLFSSMFDFTIDDWINYTTSRLGIYFNNYLITFVNYLNAEIARGAEYAIKDPDPQSWRGYMYVPGYEWYGIVYIPAVIIPDDFPTTPEWEGTE